MVRAALTVSDLDRSREFYKSVIGLTEVFRESTVQGGNMHSLIGMPSSIATRICILKTPNKPAYGMVGLFEIKNPAPPVVRRPSQGSNIGEFCIVFYCDDLDPVFTYACEHGLEVVAPPTPLRIGGNVKQREMTLRGPDGELINLIEWDLARADAGDRPETWPGVPE